MNAEAGAGSDGTESAGADAGGPGSPGDAQQSGTGPPGDGQPGGPAERSLFIGARIDVEHDETPPLVKRPGPPDAFQWDGVTHRVAAVLIEWHDYRQRGKTRRFYEKERGSFRAMAAERHGSFGVGRDYFRVRTEDGRLFELYYDRAPERRERPEGGWFLWREILVD